MTITITFPDNASAGRILAWLQMILDRSPYPRMAVTVDDRPSQPAASIH